MLAKHKVRVELDRKEEEKKRGVGLGLVAGYGSDEESSDDEKESEEGGSRDGEGKQDVKGEDTTVITPLDPEEAVKEARRLKAKEWAEKRRAMKEAEDKS